MALIETFSETFAGTTLPAGWTAVSAAPVIADGYATYSRAAGAGQLSGSIRTNTRYALAGSSVRVRCYVASGAPSGASCRVYFYNTSTLVQPVGLYLNNPAGKTYFYWRDASNTFQSTTVDTPSHTGWVRLRDGGSGVIYLDTSPDGVTWTDFLNTGSPIYLYSDDYNFALGTLLPASVDASSVVFDQVNGVPPATSKAIAVWNTDAIPPTTEVTGTAAGSWSLGGPITVLGSALWNVIVPPVWSGVTVGVDVGAGAGDFGVEPGYWLTGATARIAAHMAPPSFALGAGPPVWTGATTVLGVDTNPGTFITGTHVVGDSFYVPVDLTGLTGVGVANLAVATLQPGEPYTHGLTRSWWFRYTSAGPGSLTVTSLDTTPHWIDIYTGDALADLQVIGSVQRASAAAILTVPVTTGTYYIRVISSTADADVAISYNATVEDAPLIAALAVTTIPQAPAPVIISVLNALPDEPVEFAFSPPVSDWLDGDTPRPIVLAVVQADTTGTIAGAALTIPEVQAGTHAITVRGTLSGRTDSVALTIETDPPPLETVPEVPEPPEYVVGYWNLHDAAPGGLGLFTFPINPASMTSPHAPRNITAEHTTAADGQPILWEGGLTAHDWTFSGYLETQEFHDTLVAYASLNRRLHLRDHRGRVWLVGLRGIDIKPVRNLDKPWAHKYTVSAQIYGQVS